ncbi:f420-dependent NADP reductase [Lophium mytilinum]|uniref:F420-dependent NADP reductase n=1 Tax=Lophium mytilinum TaxID=390894 RepID=A0A6A6QI99_9PEZI|nr:f420-dependent NADP reductase [Lophium mytilinum]
MRIAIAGTGDVSKLFVEEFLKASHEVVVLARGPREWFTRPDVALRQTDYSVSSLTQYLEDCDGLISAIQDNEMTNVNVHLAMLEACKKSPKCKRFIPSEYIGDVEKYPEQPEFYFANHQPIRDALAAQKDVEWTLFNLGWLADYLVPQKNRYIRNIDDAHPVNFNDKTMIIPGTGDEPITCTAVRDGAKAIAHLFNAPAWEPVTYISGEATTWNQVKDLLAKHGNQLKISYRPKAELMDIVSNPTSHTPDDLVTAQFGMWSASGSTRVPEEKAAAHKEKFFAGLQFQSIEEILSAVEKDAEFVM